MPSTDEDKLQGLILGAALGDALGLPCEGLSRKRIQRFWPGSLRHHFFFGTGMGSDDTEHLFLTGQALLEAKDDVSKFQRTLAGKLRWWVLAFPAGVGLATARSLAKLWLGFPPSRSGIRSAGNGPGMRSTVIGAVCHGDTQLLQAFVTASTRITHTDPRANVGALALAHAAAFAWSDSQSVDELFAAWMGLAPEDSEWQKIVTVLTDCLAKNSAVDDLATALGCHTRVSGYIYQSVPVALYAWLRHRGDFRATIESCVRCGGDTDTVASFAGALAGLDCGAQKLPQDWIRGYRDWPRTSSVLLRLGSALASSAPPRRVRYQVAGIIPRNLFFLAIVIVHGLRRLLPPY